MIAVHVRDEYGFNLLKRNRILSKTKLNPFSGVD